MEVESSSPGISNLEGVGYGDGGPTAADLQLINDFEQAARVAPSLQLHLLSSILISNASCHYLLDHGLDHRSDPASFKSCIPIVEYEDIEPLIQRIADGDTSPILSCQHVSAILLSSGTSAGKPRMVPATQESRQITTKRFFLSNAYLNREFPINCQRKALNFIYAGKLLTTRSGLKAGSASTHHLRGGNLSKSLPQWTSPMGVVLGSDIRQSMYCHLLCGLLQATEVTVISSFLAYGITEAFRMLEEVWKELIMDIRLGTLSDRITEEAIRADVLKILHPDPQLADHFQVECAKNCWFGIAGRLWPNVKYVQSIMTGAMEPYIPYLKHYAGNVPLVCGDYGSSECTIGINLNLKSPLDQLSFTLMPSAAYFEFLPLDEKAKEPSMVKPVDITAVHIGEEYELVVTTLAGLYRYRLGDVVRITGFYHLLPKFAYVRRRNVLLSINTDKTDEKELYLVINQACKILKDGSMDLLDFTSYADQSSRPGHYAIFWELRDTTSLQDSVLARCCETLDLSFNDPYRRGRAAGTIGSLRLHILKESTFYNIMKYAVESGASPTQYKTPRCVKSPDVMNILRNSTIRVYCSS